MGDNTKPITRRRVLRTSAGLTAAGVLAGCASDEPTSTSGGGGGGGGGGGDSTDTSGGGGSTLPTGSLSIGQAKSGVHFDPIRQMSVPASLVANRMYSTIYTYGEGTDIQPEIATELPEVTEDGTRWTFDVREDATFQNGDPVTPEDVAYSIEQPVVEETQLAADFNMVESVAIDGQTLTIDLAFPYAVFQHSLVQQVVPKSVREEEKVETGWTGGFIGSGPFQLVDFQEGEHAQLERWDDYWGGPMPNLSEVEFVPIPEPTTRLTSFQNNETPVIQDIPPKLWGTIEGMNDATIMERPGISYFYAAFNCNEGPTTDPEVRRAVDLSFSMDDAVSNFVEPTGVRVNSPIPAAISEDWGFPTDEWADIQSDQDVDEAKSILDSNENVPADWEMNIIVPPDNKREQIGTSIGNGLSEAGYGANVQRLDWGTYLEKFLTGDPNDYNLYVLGWSGPPDPSDFLYNLFAQDMAGTNQGHFYENDELDQALNEARQMTDREERKPLYEKAVRIILEERVNLPSYTLKNTWAVKDMVTDFTNHPIGYMNPRLVTGYNNVGVE
jgi:peptide/nickel transport system substrate-binding protein